MDDLSRQIKKLKDGVKSNPNALKEMLALSEEFPGEPQVWRGISYIYAVQGDRASSIEALDRAIALSPDEPVYFFDRARRRAAIGDFRGTIEDAVRGIELSERLQYFYYKEALIFLRAYAHVELGDFDAAKDDLASMNDRDARIWIAMAYMAQYASQVFGQEQIIRAREGLVRLVIESLQPDRS
jgi:tetratricopeptide (TPR) repeat protein